MPHPGKQDENKNMTILRTGLTIVRLFTFMPSFERCSGEEMLATNTNYLSISHRDCLTMYGGRSKNRAEITLSPFSVCQIQPVEVKCYFGKQMK